MANFEVFRKVISSSKNLVFLKSASKHHIEPITNLMMSSSYMFLPFNVLSEVTVAQLTDLARIMLFIWYWSFDFSSR